MIPQFTLISITSCGAFSAVMFTHGTQECRGQQIVADNQDIVLDSAEDIQHIEQDLVERLERVLEIRKAGDIAVQPLADTAALGSLNDGSLSASSGLPSVPILYLA